MAKLKTIGNPVHCIISFSLDYKEIMESIKNALNVGENRKRYSFWISSMPNDEGELELMMRGKNVARQKDIERMQSFATGFWLSFMEYSGE